MTCPQCGTQFKGDTCPQCGTEFKVPCEVYSRIVGYIRPTRSWAQHKRNEFQDRVVYTWAGEEKI